MLNFLRFFTGHRYKSYFSVMPVQYYTGDRYNIYTGCRYDIFMMEPMPVAPNNAAHHAYLDQVTQVLILLMIVCVSSKKFEIYSLECENMM